MLFYIGEYNKQILAISESKSILEKYLKSNRCLLLNSVNIRKQEIDESALISYFYDYLLVEYYDTFITVMDIKIIERDCSDLYNEINETINNLRHLVFLINNIKRIKGDSGLFINIINKLISYLNNKKLFTKLQRENFLHHPIINCDIDVYLKLITGYMEYREMQFRYECQLFNEM